jgi:hypothetical protein
MSYYNLILKTLMISLTKANIQKELGLIADAFQNSIIWAENE